MAKQPLRDQYVAALLARGCRVVESRSRRYTQLQLPDRPGMFYFVGRAGAVRRGANATSSIACSDAFKASILKPKEESTNV